MTEHSWAKRVMAQEGLREPPEPERCICKRGPDGEPTGWFSLPVPHEHHWFGRVFPCVCRLERARGRWPEYCQRHSGLSGSLSAMWFGTFDTRRQARAYGAARAFALCESSQHFLVLVGAPGTGKTHLAASIVNHMVGNAVNAHYAFAPEWLEELRAGYSSEERPYQERVNWYRRVKVLALDDVRESTSAWVNEQLHLLVDYRLREGLGTVITSNLTLVDMEDRLRSRLSDRALVQVVVMESDDYRMVPPDVRRSYEQQEGEPF